MNDGAPLPDTGAIAAGIALITLVGTGLVLLFRAAFRIGVESRANERIALDLAEIKVQLRTLAEHQSGQNQAVLLRLVAVEGRVEAIEKQNTRRSREDIGE